MNSLFRMRRDMVVTSLVPLKYIMYMAILSDVVPFEVDGEDIIYAVSNRTLSDIRDSFHEWEHSDSRMDACQQALEDLGTEGLLAFDSDDSDRIYVGEFRGRRLFTFEVKNSLSDKAMEAFQAALKNYRKSKSSIAISRGNFLRSQAEKLFSFGIDKLSPNDFTELHGILYEIYTGGEIYNIRNKVEYFQTNNMLKAYDKFTTFAIIVEAVLNYDTYRTKGIPTLTNVAFIKDDVFRKLTNPTAGSKDYMRDIEDSGEF